MKVFHCIRCRLKEPMGLGLNWVCSKLNLKELCQLSRKKPKVNSQVSKAVIWLFQKNWEPKLYIYSNRLPNNWYISRYIKGCSNFIFNFNFFSNSQIWLNPLMDDHHFSYITKLKKKKKTVIKKYHIFSRIYYIHVMKFEPYIVIRNSKT